MTRERPQNQSPIYCIYIFFSFSGGITIITLNWDHVKETEFPVWLELSPGSFWFLSSLLLALAGSGLVVLETQATATHAGTGSSRRLTLLEEAGTALAI